MLVMFWLVVINKVMLLYGNDIEYIEKERERRVDISDCIC